ncbi:hypothetical protein [Spiroplasma ixodetis]|uniref:hypothetical protein n=1 Tax=Spiroplasma ixodetis TaxID=2141 RepID=UPI002578E7C5|nr:hypothetical protein [Spiroplasma ixodetis]WJG69438.1 hypothetical protein SIXOD_v1c03030 [Spiroplasma ixodetis Y32]
MFFDEDEEKLEEARYEEIQTNIQNLTLTIDVNIFVKDLFKYIKAFLPLCTIFKFYHINAEKSLSTDFSPHF